ncbi:MAG: glycoside hydrolase family 92 protein [Bacteroidetes bacterium]|nr:MAG: glycoside hydrolase family 92 protein [Bacteroidota bacterium]
MNRTFLFFLLSLGLMPALWSQSLVDYVNPLMGTDSDFSLSNGNTYPALARPWGMNFWTPQTGKMGDGWAYAYDAKQIRGIKQTHQPSPWINDYAAFSLMAGTGPVRFDEDERASWFSHKAEVVQPHYYKVYLADYDVTAEVTPTERAAAFRFTFPAADTAWILLDAFDGGSEVRIDPSRRRIIGYCRNNHGGVPRNFFNYFVAEFDHEVLFTHTWHDSTLVPNSTAQSGDHVGLVVGLRTRKGTQVHMRVASSFISPEQAQRNLDREVGKKTFDQVRTEGRAQWEQELGRIIVEGGSLAERETFYSCLYRVLLFPRAFYEYDADSQVVHYSPYNGEIRPGYLYTDNGFWDTFRAVFPFFTLMYPELNAQIMEGLVHTYEESGWLPEWASPGHRDCMIGSNSASLIADAYLKGIRGYDIEKLYEAIVKNTESVGPVSSVGRYGAEYYNELGYVPYDVGIRENTARTLEYAYADFAVMRLAEALERPEKEVQRFAQRSQNYRNVFDPETRLMRGRNQDGRFQAPFNPFKWGDAFTEGNSWHYTWSVFHDVAGLMDLMGGEAAFVGMLDSVFTMPPIYDESYYGFPIHEIREMQIMNMGQYAHGNQPIQHMVYLYPYAGAAWKTQARVREIMNKLYAPTPDGYCGDEDNGQTSAWYVFSALGFYPVCPGTPQYVLGSPLFTKATLHMPGGQVLTIEAPENSPEAVFIESARLNGALYSRHWLDHHSLQAGGHLFLDMGSTPNRARGLGQDDRPWSMSGQ